MATWRVRGKWVLSLLNIFQTAAVSIRHYWDKFLKFLSHFILQKFERISIKLLLLLCRWCSFCCDSYDLIYFNIHLISAYLQILQDKWPQWILTGEMSGPIKYFMSRLSMSMFCTSNFSDISYVLEETGSWHCPYQDAHFWRGGGREVLIFYKILHLVGGVPDLLVDFLCFHFLPRLVYLNRQ